MQPSPRVPLVLAVACALAASSLAQSFNVDVGANLAAPLPSNGYGAAANQPGFWSPVSSTQQTAVALKNLVTNATTTVTITPTGGYGDFHEGAQGWPGDDRLLMADAADVANAGTPPTGGLITWVISGLQAGNYVVYTYAVAPDFPATYATTVEVVGAPEGAQACTGTWTGSPHVLGVSYARHTITLGAAQTITVRTSNASTALGTNQGTVNGFQLVLDTSTPFVPECFGDTSALCPCTGAGGTGVPNAGAAGHGCANAAFASGALLTSSGSALDSAADTLVLTATNLSGPGLFFQSNGTSSLLDFGDGRLCATSGIVRLGVVFPAAGSASYPGGTTPAPIHVAGGPIGAPATKHYQCWYRDGTPGYCNVETYNTSNGIAVVWGP